MIWRGIFSVLLLGSLGFSGVREVPGDYPFTTRTDSLGEFLDALTVTTLSGPA